MSPLAGGAQELRCGAEAWLRPSDSAHVTRAEPGEETWATRSLLPPQSPMAVTAYRDPAQVSAASCGYHPSARARPERGPHHDPAVCSWYPGKKMLVAWERGAHIHHIYVSQGFVTVAVCKGLEGRLGIGDTESVYLLKVL